jgi:transposase
MRTQTINQLRAQLRQEGIRLSSGSAETVVRRFDALAVPAALRVELAALRAVLARLAPLIAEATADIGARASADPVICRLRTVPGIGPMTAVTYRAALDTWERFGDASASTAYLGLVPREDSSGTRHRKGAITKAGPGPVRALLVQAAWVVWRQRQGRAALHAWVERLAARRGRRIAVVALARRLARILYAVWRDETEYQAVPRVTAA